MMELMIGITISSLLTIAVVTVFVSQTAVFTKQSSRNQAAEDAWDAYSLLSNLIKHAEIDSFVLAYGIGERNTGNPVPVEVASDALRIDFTLPSGMAIWPNVVPPDFDRNQIRITWSNTGAAQYQIMISTSPDGLNYSLPILVAGGDDSGISAVINLDLWPLDADGQPQAAATDTAISGYQMVLSTRAGYKSGDSDPVFTITGMIVPRN